MLPAMAEMLACQKKVDVDNQYIKCLLKRAAKHELLQVPEYFGSISNWKQFMPFTK
jgi:hypothetical protein